jgi:hypothetical protein
MPPRIAITSNLKYKLVALFFLYLYPSICLCTKFPLFKASAPRLTLKFLDKSEQ